jgi:antitoxin-like ribbon-helix-helix protein
MPRKIIKFAPEDWVALDQLARERGLSLQQLADEAFQDVLKKHGRTADKAQRNEGAEVIRFPKAGRRKHRL